MRVAKGEVVVVTGAGAGLGRAIAQAFSADGAKLVLCDLDRKRIDAVETEMCASGTEVISTTTDVADPLQVDALIQTALDAFGRIDVLINNAGVMDKDRGVGELALEDWHRVLSINLTGAMLTMRAAVPHMVDAGGGHVLNIASSAALRGGAAGAAYTAAKHGLVGLTRSTAWLYAAQRITCNAIAPSGMDTEIEMPKHAGPHCASDKALAAVRATITDTLDPVKVAQTVRWAACMARTGMNGAVIPVDGGWSAG